MAARRSLCVAITACGLLSLGGGARAAGGPLAVDLVSLKSGKTLRGAILARQADGTVLMAVSRTWLKQADPKEFDRQSRTDSEEQRSAWTQTLERIESLLADPPESQRLSFFYKEERQRIERLLQDDPPPELPFLVIEIPAHRVAKWMPAAADRQRIAQFAWKEGVPGVETRPAAELRQDLIAVGVDVDGPPPDLSELLPARRQSDAEWSTRLAVAAYTLDDGLDFQGMGDTLVRTGAGQEFDLAALLPKLLTSQVDSLLGDLLGQPKQAEGRNQNSRKAAISEAERSRQIGIRVTRLDLNAERKTVAVQTEFIAKLAEEKWQTIWAHMESADGSQARPEAEARIAADPQVKSLLASIKKLGLGADDAVMQALRVGAATMAAQQAADAKFMDFRDRFVKRLDGPVLVITETR